MKYYKRMLLFASLSCLAFSLSYGQSVAKDVLKKSYLQLSGIIYTLGDIKGENSSISGYHLQVAAGIRFKPKWGLGLGAAGWGLRDGGYSSTHFIAVAPHIRHITPRWITQLELGVLAKYRFWCNDISVVDNFSLARPFMSPFLRLQGGIRFFKRWVAGWMYAFLLASSPNGRNPPNNWKFRNL